MKILRTIAAAIFLITLVLSAQAQSLDDVLARLGSESVKERVAALRQLAKMPANFRAVEPLTEALRDTSSEVRREALKTWGIVGNAYDRIVSAKHSWDEHRTEEQNRAEQESEQNWQKALIASLVARVEDASEPVRREAVRTLAKLGPSVKKIVPPYSEGCYGDDDLSSYLWWKADDALDQIANQHITLFRSLAQDRDAQEVFRVTSALLQVEEQPTLSIFRSFLRHSDPLWRMIGCVGLSRRDASDADIAVLLADSDDRVRECATYHIEHEREMVSRLAPAFPQVSVPLRRSILRLAAQDWTHDYDPLVQAACGDENGEVVADALSIVEGYRVPMEEGAVINLLRHPHPRVRKEAARVVKYRKYNQHVALLFPLLDDPAKIVREELICLLSDAEDPRLPVALVRAYRRNQCEPEGWVSGALRRSWASSKPLVRRLLKDPDWRLRVVAVDALDRSAHPEIMDWLAEAARDSHPQVRSRVASRLYKAQDLPATRILVKLLGDRDREVRWQAVLSLNGTEDAEARLILTRLSQSADENIAADAQDSLDGRSRGVNP